MNMHEYDIDPDFSVYHLVKRVEQTSALLNHRRTMNYISYEIENASILDRVNNRVFSGFQYLSKFIPQIKRYQQIAAHADEVYVFGVPDVTPPAIPNVYYVPLKPTDQLAREWFLISHGADYYSALATEELTQFGAPDEYRMFKGLWSFDLDMVQILADWLTKTVDTKPQFIDDTDYNHVSQNRLVNRSVSRLLATRDDLSDSQEFVVEELRSALKSSLGERIEHRPHTNETVILFSDIRNFTPLTETLAPQQLVETVINPYVATVSQAIKRYGGQIDKFLGDGVLAVFGLESYAPQDSVNALLAAKQILDDIREHHDIQIGIGVAKGAVMVGNIGDEHYRETTVIGDAVNVAQRLSDIGQNEIWLSHTIYDALPEKPTMPPDARDITLKGKTVPHRAYRMV